MITHVSDRCIVPPGDRRRLQDPERVGLDDPLGAGRRQRRGGGEEEGEGERGCGGEFTAAAAASSAGRGSRRRRGRHGSSCSVFVGGGVLLICFFLVTIGREERERERREREREKKERRRRAGEGALGARARARQSEGNKMRASRGMPFTRSLSRSLFLFTHESGSRVRARLYRARIEIRRGTEGGCARASERTAAKPFAFKFFENRPPYSAIACSSSCLFERRSLSLQFSLTCEREP